MRKYTVSVWDENQKFIGGVLLADEPTVGTKVMLRLVTNDDLVEVELTDVLIEQNLEQWNPTRCFCSGRVI